MLGGSHENSPNLNRFVVFAVSPSLAQSKNCIGNLGKNPYNSNSTSNPYGAGSPFKSDSPTNPYGKGLRIFGEWHTKNCKGGTCGQNIYCLGLCYFYFSSEIWIVKSGAVLFRFSEKPTARIDPPLSWYLKPKVASTQRLRNFSRSESSKGDVLNIDWTKSLARPLMKCS